MDEENDIVKNIETIFLNSCSSEELFDAFHYAIKKRINDPTLYKILIANPVLTLDEIRMYSNKAVVEFPELLYPVSLWAAKVLEPKNNDSEYLEHCLYYFTKAIQAKPTSHEPLINLINIYNTDIVHPVNNKIIEIIERGVKDVDKKSRVYHALSLLYRRMNNETKASKYAELAAKCFRDETIG